LNITEVRVKLMRNRSDRLRAFCSITIDDDFVVHDLRVIEGRKGFFVAMPSRKLTDNCPECGSKNALRVKYCSNCGTRLDETRATEGPGAREKFHVDVAHPINTPCREMIQQMVLAAYRAEKDRAERGLPPQHEYEPEGLEESDYEEYDETEDETAEEPTPAEAEVSEAPAPGEPQQEAPEPEPPTAETEQPLQEQATEEPAAGLQPEPEAAAGVAFEEEEEPEQKEEPSEEEEPEDEGFGAGIF
jgi:stage V sporulation protein G